MSAVAFSPTRKDDLYNGLKNKQNWLSALQVAMVAMCLSIALSIASGGTPMMGLQAAIYGPFLSGLFGGSAYNILGPAGALVNILNKESAAWGPEILPALAIFGGAMGFFVFWFAGHKYVNEVNE